MARRERIKFGAHAESERHLSFNQDGVGAIPTGSTKQTRAMEITDNIRYGERPPTTKPSPFRVGGGMPGVGRPKDKASLVLKRRSQFESAPDLQPGGVHRSYRYHGDPALADARGSGGGVHLHSMGEFDDFERTGEG